MGEKKKRRSKKIEEVGTRKIDIVRKIAEDLKYGKNDVKAVLDAFLDLIKAKLMSLQEISLSGIGTFKVKERKARQGFNPIAKTKMDIPARMAIKFKLSKDLRRAMKDAKVPAEGSTVEAPKAEAPKAEEKK